MKAELSGGAYSVRLDESDVRAFAERWPCYGERRPIAFTFSAENGDLVDIEGDESGTDEAGLAALANDSAYAGALILELGDVAALRRPFADPGSPICEAAGRFTWSRPLGGAPMESSR